MELSSSSLDRMNLRTIKAALRNLSLGGIRYFNGIGSTNDHALVWAAEGAPDLALVVSNEQTAGRGRGARSWYTPPGVALAFSLILRPRDIEKDFIALFSALGALAVVQTFRKYSLHPEIKWPNDVLLNRKKVCGILVEIIWLGDEVVDVVLGIGINVKIGAIPQPHQIDFPATCLQTETGREFDRSTLLHDILVSLLELRPVTGTNNLLLSWEKHLAFRGEKVEIWRDGERMKVGQIDGMESDGSLRLIDQDGNISTVCYGEVRLRPVL